VTALSVRSAGRADAPAVAALLARVGGPLVESAEEVAAELATAQPADTFVVEDAEAPHAIAGIAGFIPRGALIADARLSALPGREPVLIEALERRAAALRLPVVRMNTRPTDLDLGDAGYTRVRTFLRLVTPRADLAASGEEAPDVQPCAAGDPALHALEQAGFSDHWGFLREPYGDWHRRVSRFGDASPAFLARLDAEPAGGARVIARFGRAWIASLVVAPEARRRGLGEALVRAVAAASDTAEVGLEVDAQNADACRLYERLGFVEVDRREFWEKELAA
jgi:ribosomal protein S18 acetylase RimI-like enzyme